MQKKKYSRTTHRKENASSYRPAVSLEKAKVSYFIHDGVAHSIASCSDEVFKEAVLKLASHWMDNEMYSPILEDSMDIYTRWWLLCSLADSERAMKVYTRDELKRTMNVCELIV